METLSSYARQFMGGMERPDVDKITGLSPVISIEQKSVNKNPRSTVGRRRWRGRGDAADRTLRDLDGDGRRVLHPHQAGHAA